MQWTWAILSSLTCPALQYFSIFSHKRKILEKRNSYLTYLRKNVCFDFLLNFYLKQLLFTLRTVERDMVKTYIGNYSLMLETICDNNDSTSSERPVPKFSSLINGSTEWYNNNNNTRVHCSFRNIGCL